MQSRSAVIVIPNDTARTGGQRPLFLAPVMGAPLLTWLANALSARGVNRFFLVCQERYLSEAKLCLPAGCDLYACADREAGDPLHVFLSCAQESEQQALVITGPCVCLPPEPEDEPQAACACRVRRDELLTALDAADFSFSGFLLSRGNACTQLDGMYSVSGTAELAAMAGRMKHALLRQHARNGVEIWDDETCYVDPGVTIGAGTALRPGSVLRGHTTVGSDCVIGPNAWLENAAVGSGSRINASHLYDCTVGSDCTIDPYSCIGALCTIASRVRVGAHTDLSAVHIGEGSHIGAGCCLRELTCGRSCVIGAGVLTAACLPEATGRTTIEDDAIVGAGTIFAGPGAVGRSAAVSPGSAVTSAVPPQALATARGRQTVRKDWALGTK